MEAAREVKVVRAEGKEGLKFTKEEKESPIFRSAIY
jgi:hypothetical protein